MQRIYPKALTPEQYITSEAHRQVIADLICPRCGKGRLQRHGKYGRGITRVLGQLLWLFVARFIRCMYDHAVSYLPSFALSYRIVQVATFEAFLDAMLDRVEILFDRARLIRLPAIGKHHQMALHHAYSAALYPSGKAQAN